MPARLEIMLRPELPDAEGESIRRKAKEYFGLEFSQVRVIQVLTLDTDLSQQELEAIRCEVFTNPVTELSSYRPLAGSFDWAVWVGLRPGVRDNPGATAVEAIQAFIGRLLAPEAAVYASKLILFVGNGISQADMATIAQQLLANDIIQQFRIFSPSGWDSEVGLGIIIPKVQLDHQPTVTTLSIDSLETLKRLSAERHLALQEQDAPIIREYYLRPEVQVRRAALGLGPPTDVELEYLAQARSDHCNHNTFRGMFDYHDLASGERLTVNNLFKTCIEQPTLALAQQKPWVASVLWDNAGAGSFDEEWNYVITGETHNSPSNMEAYGGSLTGIVGVYRDPLGTGRAAKLIAGLYGFCVGPRDYQGPLRPHLHPRRLLDGVIEGVKDGGNKSGIPTPLGTVYFNECYLGKCLVFVAAIGFMPKQVKGTDATQKTTSPGDLIFMCGGRVGKDGIHGVTASSEVFGAHTPAGHVQIGDPYTQKKMHDFLLEARDLGYIAFITDCGGGGLSSAVGESARFAGGCEVWLDKVPLKYQGLDQWEIWISESQERMVVAVRPEHAPDFQRLAAKQAVEVTNIGRYTDTGVLHLLYAGQSCAYIDLKFLESDFPPWRFEADWTPPEQRGLTEPVLGEPTDHTRILRTLLARPNICSREWIVRQYDHEVQGNSVIKPLVGKSADIPSDAVVIRPRPDSNRALAVSMALHPAYGQVDAYHMTAASIDEAVRRLLAVGGRLDHLGGVDNFCWPSIRFDPEKNPDGRFKAAQLVRANWALRDYCLAYGIPLLSGKDSMYIDGHLPGKFGETHKISGFPTLLFTAVSVIPDATQCLTLDLKEPGDYIYLLGETRPELGGSEFYELLGYVGLRVPQTQAGDFLTYYQKVEACIEAGLLASCHGIYRGGLAVHLAMAAMAGELGLEVELAAAAGSAIAALYSESTGRFLVSVAPGDQARFEALMQGSPLLQLGRVRSDDHFLVTWNGQLLIQADVRELKADWRQRFAELI
ncbi:AIR synthase-related protein [Desulfobacca acetoxidans]|uniref:Phosphoribosylformylglycinamidine synthase subunit PurL n=1 Tax=Desulfobacca acetoxidans (strain ATCC 700848 / DSM 11109 / ASRB2) TaxID=880072 RepID=F2NCN5_DESAR|nr:AIR synthase-related protein [Desulfobacca acetoxidans]AEB09169.1 Phosphoribosylformylglycinamidine synthase [Desulfobacca acetoxidans DSM 11109]